VLQISKQVEKSSLLDAVSIYQSLFAEQEQFKSAQQAIKQRIRQAQKRIVRRYQSHLHELAECDELENMRRYGELLYANLSLDSKRRGRDRIEVLDYYSEELAPTSIPLDPKLSLSDNARLYFKQYEKLQRRQAKIQPLIDADRDELEALDEAQVYLEHAENLEDLTLIANELEGKKRQNTAPASQVSQQGFQVNRVGKAGNKQKQQRRQLYEKKKKQAKKQRREEIALPPRRFRLKSGVEVWVGRNRRQNDELSLKSAAKTDTWFHLKGASGTHLILRKALSEASDEELLCAASLCAWFSQKPASLSEGAKVEVDLCSCGRLRKPKGAAAGLVIYDAERTIRIAPASPEALGLERIN
ncbi:MAG: NFACT family protein, partial [Eubacteriales bacterium]|nr:NFACT family protein [Eubacteriales bacterium]